MRRKWNVLFKADWIQKVWGHEMPIVNNGMYCGKILVLNKNYRCSDHYHKIKHETFLVMAGRVLLAWEYEGEYNFELLEGGDAFEVPPYMVHSFWGVDNASILEISTEDLADDSYRNNKSHKLSWSERRQMKKLVKYRERRHV